ncbi:MAG: TatD family hydrolase [Candidatus Brocadiia bacterium]
MELFDSHAHLNSDRFTADLAQVLQRAREAGVARMVCPGVDLPSSRRAVELTSQHPERILAAVGIHPTCWTGAGPAELAVLEELAGLPQVVAIGETGLDFHRQDVTPEAQEEGFRHHMTLARSVGKPLIVHSRRADEAVLELLRAEGAGLRGVRHCFDRPMETARQYLELGFNISLAAAVTREGYKRLKKAVRRMPPDRLLIETDCPYQTPAGRGRVRNEPAFLVETAEAVARLRGQTPEEIARVTAANAAQLFGIR